MLSPGYIGENKQTAVDKEVSRLYEITGDTSALPNWSEYTSATDYKLSVDGTPYVLTPSEWTQYQKTRGAATYSELEKLFDTRAYQNLSDADKADVVSRVIGYASDQAKKEFVESKGVEYEAADFEEAGIDIASYALYKSQAKQYFFGQRQKR